MSKIRILVSCHRKYPVPDTSLLLPIHVGAALCSERYDGFLHDDIGDNISAKNRSYCELTAQYWAWKNLDADYYGFFHYRRYLYPNLNEKRPYVIKKYPEVSLLKKMGYTQFKKLIEDYDIILPIREDMRISARQHYMSARHHKIEDLELVEQIVREISPCYVEAMESYLSNTKLYFGNMYIMRREHFNDYCNWLFPVLEEFDHRRDTSGYSEQELRVDGYLAERLLGVYVEYHRPYLKLLEIPRVHFSNGIGGFVNRFINALLPPGSKCRAAVKRLNKQKNAK